MISKPVTGGQSIEVLGTNFDVIACPGHTLDHIAYFTGALNGTIQPVLFSGDTLFAGGCGRLFEGTAEQMQRSLATFSELPENTLVYCAHEYTAANLDFAVAVEPTNQALLDRVVDVKARRGQGLATVPSTLAEELSSNPFMRSEVPDVIAAAASRGLDQADAADPAKVLAVIRSWKDSF